ncbi:DUF4180 domain-containing protein [Chryseobacterium camelliae]|uniref:DUF4180 domain-containing protein n=1 Tax=Chryseobacterium camelliae TaxID=1265445 RepID=UPI00285C4E3F|nr:DUF4180 domain-containing protein [Chryseobacterium camelliae]MDR6516752.1 hypothetical protein [Chryseobacterium camelliae]
MKIETHLINHLKIAEIITDQVILSTPEEGLDLLGNLYYQGFDGIIIHEQNITPAFFDLKTTIAGEILQKFAQYRMPLIIIGDFSAFSSKSLQDFIYESNTGRQVNFLPSRSEAIQAFPSYEGKEFELITFH